MNESREKAQEIIRLGKPVNWLAAAVIILVWILLAAIAIAFLARFYKSGS